jgi:hypothetical protein
MRKFLIACLLFSIVSLISTGRIYEPTEMSSCECKLIIKTMYGGGGCIITRAASQSNRACNCIRSNLKCTGKIVTCDSSNQYCNQPDTTKESCQQGGGNCGGY